MLSFSQRKGLKPVRVKVQIDSIDDELRNLLWNALTFFYWDKAPEDCPEYNKIKAKSPTYAYLIALWHRFFREAVDTIDWYWPESYARIREHFFSCSWNEVYDFVEFTANNHPSRYINEEFMRFCNSILEREVSAYRFVAGTITQLTSAEEISAIEDALSATKDSQAFNKHLRTALSLLSDRKSPDYRNSVKESISAVEALCKVIAGDAKASLGQALKQVEIKVPLHPSLRSAFNNLYGYTSDADGIRHALLEKTDLMFEDGKFMLVTCSAFVNYLRAKAARAGIKL